MPGFALPWSRAFRCTRTIQVWGAPGAIGSSTITAPHREYGRAPHSRVVLQLHAGLSTGHAPTSPCGCPTGPRRSRTTIGRSPPSICRGHRRAPGVGHRVPARGSPGAARRLPRRGRGAPLGQPPRTSRARRTGRRAGRACASRIHPDDPPWPIFGLPRIITNARALERLVTLVDSPANGVTFCTGSLGASPRTICPPLFVVWESAFTSPMPQRPDHG